MAMLTDFTFDKADVAAIASGETRSLTGSSGTGGDNGAKLLTQQDTRSLSKNLGTANTAVSEIPFAVASESAKRIAELTSDEEYNSLITQHSSLAAKKLEVGLSKDEFLHLQLVDWMLDCVEKSRNGSEIDSLQQLARAHEVIAARVSRTAEQLEAILETEASRHRYRKTA
jgi:hypothetical protein